MGTRSSASPVILWFRSDLRLADNPALAAAAESGAPIIPLFIDDETGAGNWKNGGASRWWLHQSLSALAKKIPLVIRRGDARQVVAQLAADTNASAVFWNRRYEPWAIAHDTQVKQVLKQRGIEAESFKGSLLFEPWEVMNKSGGPYKVFTPYSRACFSLPVRPPIKLNELPQWRRLDDRGSVDSLGLMPRIKWYGGMAKAWRPGEDGAQQRLQDVAGMLVKSYREKRDYPAEDGTSRLSPHLHFGEISPHTVWQVISDAVQESGDAADGPSFLRQLIWREFSWHMLYHFPTLPDAPWNPRFGNFKWHDDAQLLAIWQKGMTGYPIVDAGMRQLWQTGWMHNRVRMIVGSFLVKHLRLDWRQGEAWFWDTLVDADLGNNAAGWQWIAGCGADAAPYFRIFNPLLQSRKFDASGDYIRAYVPELAGLPDNFIHAPWEAPAAVLKQAGVTLGKTYPLPIVDHAAARAAALAAYQDSDPA